MNIFHYESPHLKIYHSITNFPDAGRFHMHAHENYELYYFIQGSGYYTVEGTDYPLHPGALLVMRDGEAHTVHPDSSVPYDRISINFSREFLAGSETILDALFCHRELGKENMYLPNEDSRNLIAQCMKRICEEERGAQMGNRLLAYLQVILFELFRAKSDRASNGALPQDLAVTGVSSPLMRKVLTYINNNLTTITSLDVLEQKFFFSKSHINRVFKESTGSSVWGYIVLKRLLLARTMLQEGKQATLVASECGFGDYSSFYRQFKEHFGISPIEARKK